MTARLVTWCPGGEKAPAIATVCRDSRKVAMKNYHVIITPYLREEAYAVFINFETDTLYYKSGVPKMIRRQEIGKELLYEEEGHNSLFKPKSGLEWSFKPILHSSRSIVMNLDDACAARTRRYHGPRRSPQPIWAEIENK